MFEKTTTIPLSDLKSAYNAGQSLILVCGNNMADKIEDGNTVLWHGTASPPSFTYQKSWLVPRTSSDGQGDTLSKIIQYMEGKGYSMATYIVLNEENKIVHPGTAASLKAGDVMYNNWEEPPT